MPNKTILVGAGFSSAVLSRLIKNKNLIIIDKGRGYVPSRRVENVGFLIMVFNIFLQQQKNLIFF